VIEATKELGIRTIEGEFAREDIMEADTLFFTNSLWIIRICEELEGKKLSQANRTVESLLEVFGKQGCKE
jgi:branched-subunit amino acid aminotransferase/4-amino-4-deoxychorismate lyase